jgi:putative transcriptional regulator
MISGVIRICLEELLEKRERSLYWLSKAAELPYPTLWRIQKGKVKGITFNVLERICTALECEASDLLAIEK